ncbi:MAG: chorismate synthase [Planctomycetes bacterium]|nr:chorismate synthase [Planctomycetota bacterium]
MVWRSAGESHGAALVGLVEGLPSGLRLDVDAIDAHLARRQRGYGRGGRMRIETDRVELLSGVKGGATIGSPIAFRIANKDAVIEKLPVPGDPRPGHADLAGCQKHGHRDPRAVLERASARETAVRVAAGAIARHVLGALGVEVFAHTLALGGVEADATRFGALAPAARHAAREASDFLSLDPAADERMRAAVDAAKADGDTLGGVFEVVALGLPPGLGGYASADARLTGRLGGALLSIPAIKGVEVGLGFEAARRPGSQVHDAIELADAPQAWGRFRRATNRAGGLEGGMTTGEPLVLRAAMKPIPTLRQGLPSVDFASGETVRATWQRSDVTSVPAAGVVGEAMVALVLADAVLEKFGGDALGELLEAVEAYRRRVADV